MTKTDVMLKITTVIMYIFIIGMLINLGYTIGYAQRGKDQAKWECQAKFDRTPLKEISGECLRWYEAK